MTRTTAGSRLRILYVGSLTEYGNCYERLEALRQLGHTVFPIDTQPRSIWGEQRRLGHRLAWAMGYPKDLAHVNERILATAKAEDPDVVWIDKGVVVKAATLRALRGQDECVKIAHFNPDDPFGPGWRTGWRTFLNAVPFYDAHFITRRQNVEEYRAIGAQNVMLEIPGWGYQANIHRPYDIDQVTRAEFECDVGFIGAFEEPRARILMDVGRAGISARIWGPWPPKYSHRNLIIRNTGPFGEKYGMALACFRIALCFLRKKNRDGHTVRSVEIPACGTLMMAERTADHLALFEENKEAVFFSSSEELIDKTRFYLKNETARSGIATAGRQRCLRSGYSNPEIMNRRISTLMSEHG